MMKPLLNIAIASSIIFALGVSAGFAGQRPGVPEIARTFVEAYPGFVCDVSDSQELLRITVVTDDPRQAAAADDLAVALASVIMEHLETLGGSLPENIMIEAAFQKSLI